MPKRVDLFLQFFTQPGETFTPSIADAIEELQNEYHRVKYAVDEGRQEVMSQPYLGSALILQAWLGDEEYRDLMEVGWEDYDTGIGRVSGK